jgi:urea carboxylase-associated protein 2
MTKELLYQDELPGNCHWSFKMRRGTMLRLIDAEGGANVAALFYNADNALERYNMADTLKAQHTFHLTKGHVCYSDMGRILCSIVDDTCGWHDTVCGTSNAKMVKQKYGEARYQEYRNDYYRNGVDSFLIELGKYGLGKKDLVANVNFFSKVAVDEQGNMRFDPGNARAGAYVELRFEMDCIVLLHTCPHPLDPVPEYAPKPIRYELYRAEPVAQDDLCRTSCSENQRGFKNTELYNLTSC